MDILPHQVQTCLNKSGASGEQPKMGILGKINRPLFNTLTGLPILSCVFHTLSVLLVHVSCHVLEQLKKTLFVPRDLKQIWFDSSSFERFCPN